jgi:hypothetical protein
MCAMYPFPVREFGFCNGLLSLGLCEIIGPIIPWGSQNVWAHLWRKTGL